MILCDMSINSTSKKLVVTHYTPDLDASGAVWVLKRFDSQVYADAKFAFVNPGERITQQQAEDLGLSLHEVTHVDTGLGKFDHHQPERAQLNTCATKLVYQYVCKKHPALKEDKALQELVEFINEIDHFQEIHWPEAGHLRYAFMIHELIRGHELYNPQNDESQLYFSLNCLDYAYVSVRQVIQANQIIEEEGMQFNINEGACVAMLTTNDDTIKQAQKQGYLMAIRKDPIKDYVRIKVRPDAKFDLKKLYEVIREIDPNSTWYYHPNGKMLLNGSSKHRDQVASSLSLPEIIKLIKKTYA